MIKKYCTGASWLWSTSLPIRGLALLACGLLVGTPATAHSAEARPNIVLFLVDDMGWMDSTVYGSRYYETPQMQRLAAQSMRFTDAYAVPLCSPTRASILTGQYSSRHRVTSASGHQPPAEPGSAPYPAQAARQSQFIYAKSQNYLAPELVTFAEVLRDAGYRTGHFGKWHLGLLPQYWPQQQGFETTWHCAPDPGPPSYFSPYGVSPDGRPTGQHRVGNITDGPEGEYITDRLTDEAIKFLETHREEPFLLNLWHYGVHGPWGHKESYTAAFAQKSDPRGQQRNPIMASMLKSVDDSLGRILDKLDQLGLADQTLFIFYSDNGGNTHSNTPTDVKMQRIGPDHPRYGFVQDWQKWAGTAAPTNNAPLREGKGRIYEGGQRVPLMVRWPGKIAAGAVDHTVVGAIDLYPTILAAAGLAPPQNQIVDGRSILSVLRGTGRLERDAYFTWFPHLIPAVSVRQGDWKLIRRFEPHPSYPATRELYNLRDDLSESKNLAEQMPQRVATLDALIDQFMQDTGASAPQPNPAYQAADKSEGLVPKMCQLATVPGALQMTADGKTPFLGTAQVRHAGPMKLTLRVRSEKGGPGRVVWKTAQQDAFPANGQSVEFVVPASDADWWETTLDLPVQGTTAIVRLYLPAQNGPVEIQLIKYQDDRDQAARPLRVWDFTK